MVSFSFLIAPWRVAHSECAKFSIFGNSVAFFQESKKNNVNVVKKVFCTVLQDGLQTDISCHFLIK